MGQKTIVFHFYQAHLGPVHVLRQLYQYSGQTQLVVVVVCVVIIIVDVYSVFVFSFILIVYMAHCKVNSQSTWKIEKLFLRHPPKLHKNAVFSNFTYSSYSLCGNFRTNQVSIFRHHLGCACAPHAQDIRRIVLGVLGKNWKSSFCQGFAKVFFHQRLSSINDRLPSKVVFHKRSSSIKDHLPTKVVFH